MSQLSNLLQKKTRVTVQKENIHTDTEYRKVITKEC